METNFDDLVMKIKVITQGPHGDLLRGFVDLLYEHQEEHFSPDDLAAIEEGLAQIERGEKVSWEELKREMGW